MLMSIDTKGSAQAHNRPYRLGLPAPRTTETMEGLKMLHFRLPPQSRPLCAIAALLLSGCGGGGASPSGGAIPLRPMSAVVRESGFAKQQFVAFWPTWDDTTVPLTSIPPGPSVVAVAFSPA